MTRPSVAVFAQTNSSIVIFCLGHAWPLEVAKYDDTHQISHEYIIFMQIAAHASGAVVFLGYLTDAGYQCRIFSLAPHVTDGKRQPFLDVDRRLPVTVFVYFLERAFLESRHNVLSVLQCGVEGWVCHRQVARSLDKLDAVKNGIQLVLQRTWLQIDWRQGQR